MGKSVIRIGLLGLGTVGTGVVKLLARSRGELERKAGAKLELVKIAVKDAKKPREVELAAGLVTE
ncbi:MAG: homoserine dehydrogenase, partial [bacterium]